MRGASFAFLGMALFGACRTSEASEADGGDGTAPSAAGSELPFDGRTLAGWEGDGRFWRVEDGAMVGESTRENPCERTTYLVWRAGVLGDFALDLEWRIHGGNSGVQFRSRAGAENAVAGYQADLEAGPDWTGGLYEQDGRGVVARRGERVVLDVQGGAARERFADGGALLARVDADGWNRLHLVAFGPRLTIEINGVLMSEVLDLDPARGARSGVLALQLHQGEPMRVEFRDLRLRSLAGSPLQEPVPAPAQNVAWEVRGAPQWIWTEENAEDDQTVWFRRTFELASAPEGAELWASVDNRFVAWLNGTQVAAGDDWMKPVRVEVGSALRAGANELLVRASNESSAAGLALALSIRGADGARIDLASDTSWQACLAAPGTPDSRPDDAAPWSAARSLGGLDAEPWRSVRGTSAALAGGEAPAGESIRVPDGFHVERLYSVPSESQGSWVALTVDPRGRLYASDQYGGLFRITPPPLGTDVSTRVEPLALDLGEAHGLLWAFDSLYAVVSGAGKHESGLYRARDTDGDGELDEVRLLRAFDGDGEHGPHGLVLDPDGRSLVITGGNHTDLPGPITRSRLPAHWGEDSLLPPLYDPNGHAVGIRAPGGWIVRTDPEGREWELVAAGLRNAYDIAFDADGELFTYDSDMEWDVGLPWYKPTRVLHATSGAEFGWRTGSENWPADVYDALPAAVDLELGSPTGIVFGTGTSFPAPWRNALFACDWAYGRIFAVQLVPDGASFRGSFEVFASGQPFPVTDAVVAPDGALYVTTGGRKAQSGLYRISWTGEPPSEEAGTRDPRVAELRALRRELEAAHGVQSAAAVPFALQHLGDDDRFVRYAARVALESQDPGLWAPVVREEREPRRALEGLLALVHSDPATSALEVVERALTIFDESPEPWERAAALRLLELALIRLTVDGETRTGMRARLDRHYPSGDEHLDRTLLGLLVTVGADVAERALDRLDAAATQEERIAILHALRALHTGWSPESAQRLLAAFERELASVKGGLSARGYVEKLRDEAREILGPLLDAPDAAETSGREKSLPAQRTASRATRPTHVWTMAELEPALAEVARGRSFEQGRAAYEAASCHQCHRLAGAGANLGPDLTGAAGRYSARDLLLAILEPSREVPDVWRDTELWGEDELLAVGRLEAEELDEIVVREASGVTVNVPRALVRERNLHALSRMPEGLVDSLGEQEILDLLAYVLAGGSAPAAGSPTR